MLLTLQNLKYRFGECLVSTDYSVEAPVVSGRLTIAQIEELVAKPMDTKPDKKFYLALTISGSALLIGAVCLLYTFYYGIGMWGNNQPVTWGFGIVNFVFWVGIGHAGTLISAIYFYSVKNGEQVLHALQKR
jgi:hypothetical protein